MKKFGIYYGSSTGQTAEIAKKIAAALGVDPADIHNVATASPDSVAAYDVLVMGTPTGRGGAMQDDWYDFAAGVAAMYLKGKKIALFGPGDTTMTDSFCDAVGELYDKLQPTEADFIGHFDTIGYGFDHSKAVRTNTGVAVGLLIDNVNHAPLTDNRIKAWVEKIKSEA